MVIALCAPNLWPNDIFGALPNIKWRREGEHHDKKWWFMNNHFSGDGDLIMTIMIWYWLLFSFCLAATVRDRIALWLWIGHVLPRSTRRWRQRRERPCTYRVNWWHINGKCLFVCGMYLAMGILLLVQTQCDTTANNLTKSREKKGTKLGMMLLKQKFTRWLSSCQMRERLFRELGKNKRNK